MVNVGNARGQENRDQKRHVGKVLEVTVVVARTRSDPEHESGEAGGQGEGYALIAADGQRPEQGQGQRGPEEGTQDGFKRVRAARAEEQLQGTVAGDEAVCLQPKGQFHVRELAVSPGVAELAVEVAGNVDKLWQGPDEEPDDSGGAQDGSASAQGRGAAQGSASLAGGDYQHREQRDRHGQVNGRDGPEIGHQEGGADQRRQGQGRRATAPKRHDARRGRQRKERKRNGVGSEAHAGEPEGQAVEGVERGGQTGWAFGHPETGSGKDVDGGHAGGEQQV